MTTMQSVRIVLLCIVAAAAYGIAHDQITARICVEYFTVGHPPLVDTDDPTLIGIGWGLVATWWVGLLLGVPLAIAARAGSRPPRAVGSLIHPIAWLLAIMASSAVCAGVVGWLLARSKIVVLIGPIAHALPPERHVPFIADLWAHLTSYLVGFVGGIVIVVRVWRSRNKRDVSKR